MSEIKMKEMKELKDYKMIPYSVQRTVLELKELSKYAGYKRHKDTRKDFPLCLIEIGILWFLEFQQLKVCRTVSISLV